jgi:hypothetical protein
MRLTFVCLLTFEGISPSVGSRLCGTHELRYLASIARKGARLSTTSAGARFADRYPLSE